MDKEHTEQKESWSYPAKPMDMQLHRMNKELFAFFASYNRVPKTGGDKATDNGTAESYLYKYYEPCGHRNKLYEALMALEEDEKKIASANEAMTQLEKYCKENGAFPTKTKPNGRSLAEKIESLKENGAFTEEQLKRIDRLYREEANRIGNEVIRFYKEHGRKPSKDRKDSSAEEKELAKKAVRKTLLEKMDPEIREQVDEIMSKPMREKIDEDKILQQLKCFLADKLRLPKKNSQDRYEALLARRIGNLPAESRVKQYYRELEKELEASNRVSKSELLILYLLESCVKQIKDCSVSSQVDIGGKKVDILLVHNGKRYPIEYDGSYFHQVSDYDAESDAKIKSANIEKLVRIRERDCVDYNTSETPPTVTIPINESAIIAGYETISNIISEVCKECGIDDRMRQVNKDAIDKSKARANKASVNCKNLEIAAHYVKASYLLKEEPPAECEISRQHNQLMKESPEYSERVTVAKTAL